MTAISAQAKTAFVKIRKICKRIGKKYLSVIGKPITS
jgi:hypothetical protein